MYCSRVSGSSLVLLHLVTSVSFPVDLLQEVRYNTSMANKASSHGEILPYIEPPERWEDATFRAPVGEVRELPFHDGWRQWDMAKRIQDGALYRSVRTIEEVKAMPVTEEDVFRSWEDTHPSPLRAD
jgi:hypothetical protein